MVYVNEGVFLGLMAGLLVGCAGGFWLTLVAIARRIGWLA